MTATAHWKRGEGDEPDVVRVTVTRSSGIDGAILVMIDTEGGDGGPPPLRVDVNDDQVFSNVFRVADTRGERVAGQAVLVVDVAADLAYTGEIR